MTPERRAAEEAVRACYAGWSKSYHDDYYGPGAAHPPVHRDLLLRLLRESGAAEALDVGCGPASFLRHLDGTGIRPFGFDLTPEMVVEARLVLGAEDAVWEGSALEAASYAPPGDPGRRFDAAICAGVLPHVPAEGDAAVLAHMAGAVRTGGLLAATARNALFGLFTLNRYSHELFRELIDVDGLRAEARPEERELLDAGLAELAERFRLDLPPCAGAPPARRDTTRCSRAPTTRSSSRRRPRRRAGATCVCCSCTSTACRRWRPRGCPTCSAAPAWRWRPTRQTRAGW